MRLLHDTVFTIIGIVAGVEALRKLICFRCLTLSSLLTIGVAPNAEAHRISKVETEKRLDVDLVFFIKTIRFFS